MGLDAMILVFWMLSFKPACSLSSFTLIKRLFSYCLLSAIRVVSSAYLNMKNWCFWTVVLEKTLESPLDSKEIKPVNPKGNQSWIFIGRTDAETEAPILSFHHVLESQVHRQSLSNSLPTCSPSERQGDALEGALDWEWGVQVWFLFLFPFCSMTFVEFLLVWNGIIQYVVSYTVYHPLYIPSSF